jgi:hypothetical protein
MLPKSRKVLASLLAGSMILSGCSPYRFSTEVAAVDTGVAAISEAVTSGARAARNDTALLQRLELTRRRFPLRTADCATARALSGDGAIARCRVARRGTLTEDEKALAETREGNLAQLDRVEAGARRPIAALQQYTAALRALTRSEDRQAFDAASGRLQVSLQALASVAGPQGVAVAPAVGAVAHAGFWLVGEGLDQERRARLEWAVTQAQGPVNAMAQGPLRTISEGLALSLEGIAGLRLTINADILDEMADGITPAIGGDAYLAGITSLQERAAVQDGLRRASPRLVMTRFVEAHDKLVLAVRDRNAGFGELLVAVDGFEEQATALRAALSR